MQAPGTFDVDLTYFRHEFEINVTLFAFATVPDTRGALFEHAFEPCAIRERCTRNSPHSANEEDRWPASGAKTKADMG